MFPHSEGGRQECRRLQERIVSMNCMNSSCTTHSYTADNQREAMAHAARMPRAIAASRPASFDTLRFLLLLVLLPLALSSLVHLVILLLGL